MTIDMPQNLPELLSLLLQVGLVLLVFVFVLVGFRLLKILGAVQELTASVAEIVETVNLVLWQPIRFFSTAMDKIQKLLKLKKK